MAHGMAFHAAVSAGKAAATSIYVSPLLDDGTVSCLEGRQGACFTALNFDEHHRRKLQGKISSKKTSSIYGRGWREGTAAFSRKAAVCSVDLKEASQETCRKAETFVLENSLTFTGTRDSVWSLGVSPSLYDGNPSTMDAAAAEDRQRDAVKLGGEGEGEGLCTASSTLDSSVLRTCIPSQSPSVGVSLQSNLPPRQKQESEQRDDYYVNVGYAIRTLREELPSMFYKDLTYDIYREDITFRDPLNTFSGMDNYKLIFWALRFHGRIFFKALWVDVVRVWQPSDKVIMVRWSVRGLPRVPWEAQGHFDGTSEYRLDKRGKIYEHKVDNVVMNNQQRLQPLTVVDLMRLVGARTTPTPTFFGKVSIVPSEPYLLTFSWVRFYWALRGTLALVEKLSPLALCG